MGTYKGNVGNLMQHWTLCEILRIANEQGVSGLNYIDAHAMAPLACTRTGSHRKFDSARKALSDQASAYEKAWLGLVGTYRNCYPNSAAFVRQVWKGDYSLLLCEVEPVTASEIAQWLIDVNELPECKRGEIFPGDWRKRFETRLPSPSEVGMPTDSLTLVSFDPYMVSKNSPAPSKRDGGSVYPNDLALIGSALEGIDGGVLLQLSTYSANGGNSQEEVISSTNSILVHRGLMPAAVVRANGNMMSLIYARNISWADKLANLPSGFTQWKEGIGRASSPRGGGKS